MYCFAELRSTLSKSPSLLSGSRSQQPKSEGKAKAKQSNEAGAEPSWNQVPLEALVRKSSPIAMNPKQQQEQQQQQQPAEPQVHKSLKFVQTCCRNVATCSQSCVVLLCVCLTCCW